MRDGSKGLRDDVSLLRVLLPHPSDMPVQMPPGDEVGEHLLRRPGDLFIGQMLDLPDPFTKPGSALLRMSRYRLLALRHQGWPKLGAGRYRSETHYRNHPL